MDMLGTPAVPWGWPLGQRTVAGRSSSCLHPPQVCPHPKCCLSPPLSATLSPQCPLHPFWGTPRFGAALTPPLSAALSHLQTFQALSGLLVAIVAVATVALLAVKVWPR